MPCCGPQCVLGVSGKLPVRSVQELTDCAKSRPGTVIRETAKWDKVIRDARMELN